MTWDEHYQLWLDARDRRQGNEAYLSLQAARKRVQLNSPDDWEWLRNSLSDKDRKWFVAEVFRFQPIAKRLLAPMLRAGVLERNPSLNRVFIVPCVRTFGTKRIRTLLLEYLERGSNEEIAGAASALYWAWNPGQQREDIAELEKRIQVVRLQTFVHNEDLEVRRRIIPMLSLKPEDYSEELRPLIARAIEIARRHPDEYIRHRVEKQLGAGGPYMAIPDTHSDGK